MQSAAEIRSDQPPAAPVEARQDVWQRIRGRLRTEYGEGVFNTWISRISYEDHEANGVTMILPTRFMRDRVKSQYGERIDEIWAEEWPGLTGVRFIIRSTLDQHRLAKAAEAAAPPPVELSGMVAIPAQPHMTFNTFVEAPSNELALKACMRVAQTGGPSGGANPVYLCGRQGMGKSHMLHATANRLKELHPGKSVLYLDMDGFMRGFVASLKSKSMEGFKLWLRSADVLMFDDLQFLTTRGERTREEFFSMLNALVINGRQVMVAADTLPNDLNGLEGRLRARLGAGLVANVAEPELELRLSFMHRRSRGVVGAEVLEFVARRMRSSIRELEGALNRLEHQVLLLGREVTIEQARELLAELLGSEGSVIDVRRIQEVVCAQYGVSIMEMVGKSRSRRIARPRQIAMFLANRLTPCSYPEIGRKFSRDHSTVLYGCRHVGKLAEEDPELAYDIERLEEQLRGPLPE